MNKMTKRLKYERFNNSNDVIMIDIHNDYTIIAISGYNIEKNIYNTTLFLKYKNIDKWDLIDDAARLEFNATSKTINSAILKKISELLENNFFYHYIERYEYEVNCMDKGNELAEKERMNNVS